MSTAKEGRLGWNVKLGIVIDPELDESQADPLKALIVKARDAAAIRVYISVLALIPYVIALSVALRWLIADSAWFWLPGLALLLAYGLAVVWFAASARWRAEDALRAAARGSLREIAPSCGFPRRPYSISAWAGYMGSYRLRRKAYGGLELTATSYSEQRGAIQRKMWDEARRVAG